MASSYKDLRIYNASYQLFIETHKFTRKLPSYELYEIGSQLRRSANSVCSNIVEGDGRQKYKKDLLKFLIYSHASNNETINHLKMINDLYPDLSSQATDLRKRYEPVGQEPPSGDESIRCEECRPQRCIPRARPPTYPPS